MTPCSSGTDHRGWKPWLAVGVSISMRHGRTTILMFRWARRSRIRRGGQPRSIGIDEAYPEQYVRWCVPRVVIFPQIKRQDQSTLKPSDSVRALGFLLAQSAPQLFDRSTMARHLELLKKLLQQTEPYELVAGTDLYREPAALVDLIKEVQGRKNCRELSLS